MIDFNFECSAQRIWQVATQMYFKSKHLCVFLFKCEFLTSYCNLCTFSDMPTKKHSERYKC